MRFLKVLAGPVLVLLLIVPQMDDFARHVLEGTPNRAPGEMGRRDMVIVEAIYKSIREGGRMLPIDLPKGYGITD